MRSIIFIFIRFRILLKKFSSNRFMGAYVGIPAVVTTVPVTIHPILSSPHPTREKTSEVIPTVVNRNSAVASRINIRL